MHPVAIALNIVFSAVVLMTIVGGLIWAILASRGGHHLAAAPRAQTVGPRRSDPRERPGTTPSAGQPGSRDRDPALAV